MALQIYDRRERALVTAGDAVLTTLTAVARPFRRRQRRDAPTRILLMRLERIGDLLMALPAIADVRAAAPGARIDLVVGSWNADIARSIAGVDRVQTLDAPWLARGGAGATPSHLLRTAVSWRRERYDLAVNFEPDVRTNLLLALSGAGWRAGYRSGGGGAVLDQALEYLPAEHTTDNARRLVAQVFAREVPASMPARTLVAPEATRREAIAILAGARRPRVAMHVAGGRQVKQWPVERFVSVARSLADREGATIVLTGGPGDEGMLREARAALPSDRVIDISGAGLLTVAAVFERCDLMITGDTGPMHVAAAVGLPIVAVFGPSDPRRYAPRGAHDRVVRIDLPCAPCNRIRLPPARCTGRVPDCLALLPADRVLDAAVEILRECRGETRHASA
jgi:heptosyltransferase-2